MQFRVRLDGVVAAISEETVASASGSDVGELLALGIEC